MEFVVCIQRCFTDGVKHGVMCLHMSEEVSL